MSRRVIHATKRAGASLGVSLRDDELGVLVDAMSVSGGVTWDENDDLLQPGDIIIACDDMPAISADVLAARIFAANDIKLHVLSPSTVQRCRAQTVAHLPIMLLFICGTLLLASSAWLLLIPQARGSAFVSLVAFEHALAGKIKHNTALGAGLTIVLWLQYPNRIRHIVSWTACHARRLIFHVPALRLRECDKECRTHGCECTAGFAGSLYIHNSLARTVLYSSALLFAHADFYLDIPYFIGDGQAITFATPANATRAMIDGQSHALAQQTLGCKALAVLHAGGYNLRGGGSNMSDWPQAWNVRHKCVVAAQTLGSDVCCVAWSDAFYVPAREARLFLHLLPMVADLPNEAAVPTLLHHIAAKHTGGVTRAVPCPGSCCSEVTWREALNAGCGHRVKLRRVRLRMPGLAPHMCNLTRIGSRKLLHNAGDLS